MLVLLAGCSSTSIIPEPLEPQIDKSVTFSQLLESPDSYRGKVLVLGGEVLKAKRWTAAPSWRYCSVPWMSIRDRWPSERHRKADFWHGRRSSSIRHNCRRHQSHYCRGGN